MRRATRGRRQRRDGATNIATFGPNSISALKTMTKAGGMIARSRGRRFLHPAGRRSASRPARARPAPGCGQARVQPARRGSQIAPMRTDASARAVERACTGHSGAAVVSRDPPVLACAKEQGGLQRLLRRKSLLFQGLRQTVECAGARRCPSMRQVERQDCDSRSNRVTAPTATKMKRIRPGCHYYAGRDLACRTGIAANIAPASGSNAGVRRRLKGTQ